MASTLSYAQWALEPYCIARKLRALRTEKRLTLSRLAAETGLSTALLSKLETDRMIPTLPTLVTIIRAYGVGLSYFFTDPERHAISITRRAHLDGKGRGPEPAQVTPLHALGTRPRLIAEAMEISPSATFYPTEENSELCALLYVRDGTLEMDSGGMAEKLESGDCAYIESQMPFAMQAAGKETCRLVMVRLGSETAFH